MKSSHKYVYKEKWMGKELFLISLSCYDRIP